MNRVAIAAAALLMLVATAHVGAQDPAFGIRLASVTHLPTLGGDSSYATGMSELGHVIGVSETADGERHPFIWTRSGGMRDLAPEIGLRAAVVGVNDWGQVVGWFYNAADLRRPFFWSDESGLVELPLFGEMEGAATAINNAGQILGVITEDTVIWEPDRRLTRLGSIAGEFISAEAMNEFGEVTGWSRRGLFRWTPATGFILTGIRASGADMNDRGDLVANGDLDGDDHGEPFLWTPRGAQPLLPAGWFGERAVVGVNNLRQAAGYTEAPGDHPTGWFEGMVFVWSPATGVVPVARTNVEETIPNTVIGITDQGAIAGTLEGGHAVVWQLETGAAQIAGALRVRITESARRDLIRRGHAQALIAKLDQVDRALQRYRSAAAHARALRQQIVAFSHAGALPDWQALPLRHLANVLLEKSR